jgi:shikimate dehydrogenase
VNNDGELRGYNTDGEGFLLSLRERGIEPEGKIIVILGAGGASRAISYTLVKNGASLIILNRDAEKAADLAESLGDELGCTIEHSGLTPGALEASIARADILVNTTSEGMNRIQRSSLVLRIYCNRPRGLRCLYSPEGTKLFRDALRGAKRGCTVMVIWQGYWASNSGPVKTSDESCGSRLESHSD